MSCRERYSATPPCYLQSHVPSLSLASSLIPHTHMRVLYLPSTRTFPPTHNTHMHPSSYHKQKREMLCSARTPCFGTHLDLAFPARERYVVLPTLSPLPFLRPQFLGPHLGSCPSDLCLPVIKKTPTSHPLSRLANPGILFSVLAHRAPSSARSPIRALLLIPVLPLHTISITHSPSASSYKFLGAVTGPFFFLQKSPSRNPAIRVIRIWRRTALGISRRLSATAESTCRSRFRDAAAPGYRAGGPGSLARFGIRCYLM